MCESRNIETLTSNIRLLICLKIVVKIFLMMNLNIPTAKRHSNDIIEQKMSLYHNYFMTILYNA